MRGWLLAAALVLPGCSVILDFDPEGLACTADAKCSEGFTCAKNNTCLPSGHPDTLCTPACSAIETCIRGACLPICDGRACGAGSTCISGRCEAFKRDQKLG